MSDLNRCMSRFRSASRHLFECYFQGAGGWDDAVQGWIQHEQFEKVQEVLFTQMVLVPSELPYIRLGQGIQDIRVASSDSDTEMPAMVNREIGSGYWDYPVETLKNDGAFLFLDYFDWDNLVRKDYQYVRVVIESYPSDPLLVGKHALIENRYVKFEKMDEQTTKPCSD